MGELRGKTCSGSPGKRQRFSCGEFMNILLLLCLQPFPRGGMSVRSIENYREDYGGKDEAARINQLRANDETSLVEQQARIAELSDKLRIASATLDPERQLAAKGKDIRELMAARQLQVVDVRDTDSNGKRPRQLFLWVLGEAARCARFSAPKKLLTRCRVRATIRVRRCRCTERFIVQ
jgi:hypothetical protein